MNLEGLYSFALYVFLFAGFLRYGMWRTSKGSYPGYEGIMGYHD